MRKYLLLLSLFLCLLTGCRTTKNVTVMHPATDWATLSVPFKLNIYGNISPSGKGYFVRDESIYLSVRYFGMEVMSFYANNDSCFVYDKTQGTLIACELGNNPYTHSKMNVNDLQDILLCLNGNNSPINLNLSALNINLSAIKETLTNGTAVDMGWKATLENNDTNRTLEADLEWNNSNASINPESLPQWKRPAKPKRVVGLNDLYYMIISQF